MNRGECLRESVCLIFCFGDEVFVVNAFLSLIFAVHVIWLQHNSVFLLD